MVFLGRQVEGAKAFYLAIPNDDLLHGFRKRAGKPAPGKNSVVGTAPTFFISSDKSYPACRCCMLLPGHRLPKQGQLPDR